MLLSIRPLSSRWTSYYSQRIKCILDVKLTRACVFRSRFHRKCRQRCGVCMRECGPVKQLAHQSVLSLPDMSSKNTKELCGGGPISDKSEKKNVKVLPKVSDKIHNLKEVYSTALGGYRDWSNNVDLGPPKCGSQDVQIPEEDKWVWDYYNSLQYTLYETGYPETIDRTSVPRVDCDRDRVSVTILSSPVECMAILLEGGRQSPGNFLLILSSTWISKLPSESYPDLYALFVHKAITFHRGGQSFIEEYNPPRKTTYLLNYFTGPVTSGQRTDGEHIEEDLDCPMSSSLKLASLADDKVFTRCLMADVSMAFPETLAFMYKSDRLLKSNTESIRIIHIEKNVGLGNLIIEEVKEFSGKLSRNGGVDKVVVKPSGPEFHGSIGVSYHDVADLTSIASAVTHLLKQLKVGNSVLVESFIDTISPNISEKEKPWGATEELAFRLRSTVCRGPDNRAVSTQIICGISSKSKPINGDNTICQSLDTTLLAYGVRNQGERTRVTEEIHKKSEALLEALMKYEESLTIDEKGAMFGQTDLIGIDFIITRIRDELTPVGIEVNSHDCTINCQIFEFVNAYMGYDQGESVRPLVQTMIKRSQLHEMVGKTVLVIGGGAYSKKDIWPDAKRDGINVVLVDADANHFAKDQVFKFIHYNYNDHVYDYSHAINIADQVHNLEIVIQGCVTFWEDCGPLAANICQIIGLTGNDCNAAFIAKKKSLTQEALKDKIDDIPHWPRTYLYTSAIQPINSETDLQRITDSFSFPVVLKLEYGSSAVAVSLIHNIDEMRQKYSEVKETLRSEEDYGGIGLGFGNSMAVTEYLVGSEHDVDIVIYHRKMLGAFVSDNGPTRIPHFTETAATMPSTLPSDKVSQLITAAYQCCTEIGLANGVFNVELKMTPTGPKLIEINARMGGFYLRDWINRVYGVDLMLCALMISCGIKPFIPKLKPRCQIMGVMLVPSLHRNFLTGGCEQNNIIKGMQFRDEIIWNQFENEVQEHVTGKHEEPVANIAVTAGDVVTAREKLIKLCETLKLNSDSYDVHSFTKGFSIY